MDGRNYLSDPTNPFFALEDDVDDETFLRSAPPRNQPAGNYYRNVDDDLEFKRQQLIQRRQEVEERTVQSSERSISLLRDSENIGVATAEELIKQREQLERTEKRLDDINSALRFSQKHINGIKSVFGSLKNYLSGKSLDSPTPTVVGAKLPESTSSGSIPNSKLGDSLDRMQGHSPDDHPVLKMRESMDDEDERFNSRMRNTNAVLDKNLDEMSGSLARLKGLAIGLSEEIDSQDDLIERITDKTERSDMMLQKQNKEITNLLKR